MLSKFDYVKPKTLEEAVDFLGKHPKTKVLAGGTDLLVLLRRNLLNPDHILDIKGVEGLDRLEYTKGEGLYIGARVSVNEISESPMIQEKYRALFQAAGALASHQLRNRATLVGNICNASPGADLSSPLLVYNAKVHMVGPKGKKTLKIEEFFTGVKKNALEEGEIVTGISLPDVKEGDSSYFMKQSRVKGHDLATVGISLRRTGNKETFLGMAAVAPTPIRLHELEKELQNRELNEETAGWLKEEIKNHIKPISDVRSSMEYRNIASGALAKKIIMTMMKEGVE
ncbi:FAD binding domain-containing protein [Isachenkonia alkalipeptolytica]|uniref:Xanthine dehydrogenase family protein subunit M n=1 Tax=Isachenkonia alkalipeptolytica TaxID=2565777 RepID=A0AA43XM33_9CLOT|nr:xanthine dehydrogenase family protein subunit M [Isachenkonia alkalipeptolytica]NBG89268.1 xanthine dehydrogenase family protein subunit M [Isachenkonia alkalipeptolytica]